MFWQTEILVSVTGFQHVVAGQSRGGQKVWDLGWGIPGGGGLVMSVRRSFSGLSWEGQKASKSPPQERLNPD